MKESTATKLVIQIQIPLFVPQWAAQKWQKHAEKRIKVNYCFDISFNWIALVRYELAKQV